MVALALMCLVTQDCPLQFLSSSLSLSISLPLSCLGLIHVVTGPQCVCGQTTFDNAVNCGDWLCLARCLWITAAGSLNC